MIQMQIKYFKKFSKKILKKNHINKKNYAVVNDLKLNINIL